MSNRNIIDNILLELRSLEKGDTHYKTFCKFLEDSVEALEGVPFSLVQEARDFELRFSLTEFFDEEAPEAYPTVIEVGEQLRLWLKKLTPFL